MQARRRWTNPSQPQTLQIAVFLLYLDAAFGALNMVLAGFPLLAIVIGGGGAAAGYGIANEKKWGYVLGLVMAFLPFVLRVLIGGADALFATNVLSLMFEIALVALLVHPQSRDYQRVWFK